MAMPKGCFFIDVMGRLEVDTGVTPFFSFNMVQ